MTPLSPTRSSPRQKKDGTSASSNSGAKGGPPFPTLSTADGLTAAQQQPKPSAPIRPSTTAKQQHGLPPTRPSGRGHQRGRSDKLRGRGRPPGGSLALNSNPQGNVNSSSSASINALVAAAEAVTSESKYASLLHGDITIGSTGNKVNKILRVQEKEKQAAALQLKGVDDTKASSSFAAKAVAATSQQQTVEKWTHPALEDDTSLDSEYAKFVRGLMEDTTTTANAGMDDEQSLYTFRTLQSIKDITKTSDKDVVGTIVGDDVTYSVLMDGTLDDGDDEDYQLTSDEEDDEEEEDDFDEDNKNSSETKGETRQAMLVDSSFYHKKKSMDMDLDFDLDNVFGEIEGLLEEDLDAHLTSLLQTEISNEGGKSLRNTAATTSTTTSSSMDHHNITNTIPSTSIAVVGTEQQKAITSPGQSTKKKKSTQTVVTTPTLSSPGVVNGTTEAQVTRQQLNRLRETMAKHHQLLLQQATLAVRAAYVQKVSKDGVQHGTTTSSRHGRSTAGSLPTSMLNSRQLTFCAPGYMGKGCNYENDFYHGENAEELAECLDGAVGMLQDLEQNWKDAVRNSIQLSYRCNTSAPPSQQQQGGRRNLMSAISENGHGNQPTPDAEMDLNNHESKNKASERRLTRSAFTKTLQEREMGITENNDGESSMLPSSGVNSAVRHRNSVFDVRGLARLRETFLAIDNSVKEVRMEDQSKEGNGGGINILHPADHGEACELLLRHAGAEVNQSLVPGRIDMVDMFTHAPEACKEPETVTSTLTKAQCYELRRNKNQFTAGEDNLILRGVNLYGEKEWVLVSDRFLPDRPVNGISQRYHRLCFLIYKSNGIFIDDVGKLAPLPTFKKGSAAAEDEAAERTQEAIRKIKPPEAPTTMNVHRWTMEEDVAILKSVPMMGNQWAEICNHIIPHRDRGHIRKRYQVLERRIPKGTFKLSIKRPATGELGREAAKYAKTSVLPKTKPAVQKPAPQKKTAPKKANAPAANPRAKSPKPQSAVSNAKAATSEPLKPSAQAFADKPTSSFEVTVDDDDKEVAALLHGLATPQRPRYESRPLSQDRDAAKDLAYILNGQDHSNIGGETTRMGLEKILENDWSREAGMNRLADDAKPFHSPIKSSHLPDIAMGDGDSSRLSMLNEFNAAGDDQKEARSTPGARRSLMSNAIRKTEKNASKKYINETPSSSERSVKVSGSPVKVNLGSYVSSPRSRSPAQSPSQDNIFSESFSLAAAYSALTPRMIGTPGKPDTPGLEAAKSNDEAFQYFMSESPMKGMTPSKLLPPNTPLNHLGFNGGALSGPVDAGNNSLFMAGDDDDFDCVSALQDLSNSAPPTPSKLLLPARVSQVSGQTEKEEQKESEPPKPKTSFLSKVKAKVGEKK